MSIALVREAGLSKYFYVRRDGLAKGIISLFSVLYLWLQISGHVWPSLKSEGCKVECTGRIFKEGGAHQIYPNF